MTISIYLPTILIQIFLWACVIAAFLGIGVLIAAWLSKCLKMRNGYWIAMTILTMRRTKLKDWSWGILETVSNGLREEQPELARQFGETFRDRSNDSIWEKRMRWLVRYNSDAEGYDWGLHRVKYKNGEPISVKQVWTFAEIDAEMERQIK